MAIDGHANWPSWSIGQICTILGSCRESGAKGLAALRGIASFEAILVDLQRSDLMLQSGSWYAEFGSCAGRSVHPSSAFAQRSLNGCFLLRRKPLKEGRPRVRLSCKRLPGKPTLID